MQKHRELSTLVAILALSVAILGVVKADFVGPSAAPPTGDGLLVSSNGNLQIVNSAASKGRFEFYNANTGNGDNYLAFQTAGSLKFDLGYSTYASLNTAFIEAQSGVPIRIGYAVLTQTPSIYIAANNGSVGIGTTGPGYKLDVSGDIRATGKVYANANGTSYLCGGDDACLHDVNIGSTVAIIGTSGSAGSLQLGSNTSAYLYGSGANIGIGTTAPAVKFDVFAGNLGTTAGNTLEISRQGGNVSNGVYLSTQLYRTSNGTEWSTAAILLRRVTDVSPQAYISLTGDRVGIGTVTPSSLLHVNGTITATKLDVSTIDPVYTIDGERYATYVASMIGIKEEVTGLIDVNKQTIIDFRNQEKGSDLWLFAKATDLERTFNKMVVILASSFDGEVWYEKDTDNLRLVIHASGEGEVSYRLTAPRFDWESWPNILDAEGSHGLIINTGPGGVMVPAN